VGAIAPESRVERAIGGAGIVQCGASGSRGVSRLAQALQTDCRALRSSTPVASSAASAAVSGVVAVVIRMGLGSHA
jgi:hypothetical protein